MKTNKCIKANGEPFSISFEAGLPLPLSGPHIFLLYDGSIAAGYLTREDGVAWLKSVNPVDNSPMDIPAGDIIGHASASPRRDIEFNVERRGYLDECRR